MYKNDHNTLSTAEYIDTVSDTYEDYIDSWFEPHIMPEESHKQKTEISDSEFKPIYSLSIWKRKVRINEDITGIVIEESKDRSFKEWLKLLIIASFLYIPLRIKGLRITIDKSYDYPCPDYDINSDNTDLPF